VYLPLGNSGGGVKISTIVFNRAYREWDGQSKTNLAGDFAQCLRELYQHDVKLANMKGVNADMVESAYEWLDLYDLEVQKFKTGKQEEIKKQAQPPAPVYSADYGIVMQIALAEYIKMGGPMGDPREVIRKAKAVADEYVSQMEKPNAE
jgi:hypothetical protein